MEIGSNAMEVFARGFCFTRSFTHPYVAERVGRAWMMADGARKRGDYRCEEWITHGMAAVEVDRLARERTRGRFGICAMCGAEESQVVEEAGGESGALGYRLQTTEPLMMHDLVANSGSFRRAGGDCAGKARRRWRSGWARR